jgi:hypothetical protein
MAIINSYTRDTDIKNSDVFIGTKFANRQTVNFTAQTVADYLNINGKISIAGQMLWKFVVIDPGNGTMSFEGGGGAGEAFADITELILSKTDGSGQFVNIFLDYLVDTQILLAQQSVINQFGHYKILSYTVMPDPNFYKLTLEFIGGNGGLIKDAYYDMASFQASVDVVIPNLQGVTNAGSITSNNIELIEEAELRFENIGINKRLSGASILSLTGIQIFNLPDVGGIIPISVNGQTADANGNITLPDETIPTLQEVTDEGATTTSSITALGGLISNSLVTTASDFLTLTAVSTSLIIDNTTETATLNGDMVSNRFKIPGGLSTEFLKADGTVDSNTYLTSASNYWTKVGDNIVKNNIGNVYFSGDGSGSVPNARYDAALNSITGSFSNGDFNNNSIGIQYLADGITMFINNGDALRGWLQTGRNLTLNTTYVTGFIDFMINSVSKLKLNNNGTLKYATDVSSLYDARTLIDKGYADATYATSASNYWTKTGDDIVNNNTGLVSIKANVASELISFKNSSGTQNAFISNGRFSTVNGYATNSIGNTSSGMFSYGSGEFLQFKSDNGNVGTPAFTFSPTYAQFSDFGGGNSINIYSGYTISPTGGNVNFTMFNLNPTVNQTGGASGISRALYINPILTAAADFRAIEVTVGKSIFQQVNATSFVKNGGTSSQFLKADGSIDSNTYLTSAAIPSFLEFNVTDKTVWNNGQGDVAANTSFGTSALKTNTTGTDNSAFGVSALRNNTSGSYNTAIGNALSSNTVGNNNISVGYIAQASGTTASSNVSIGNASLYWNVDGNGNTAIGHESGVYETSNPLTKIDNSVFIGKNTRALAVNDTNEIVIGADATGIGSNTVTLGNASITSTRLRGSVLGSSFVKDGGLSTQFLMADGSTSTGAGGSAKSINSVSTNTAAGSTSSTDYFYFGSGTINITLPTAVGNTNNYTIKNVGTGVITIDTTSSQTIDGSLTAPINVQYLSLTLISDGANWNII